MFTVLLSATALQSAWATPTGSLRTDGVPVQLMPPGALEAELARHSTNSVPFEPFSDAFVQHALKTGVDWREKGAVTPAKDQGAHGAHPHTLPPFLPPSLSQHRHTLSLARWSSRTDRERAVTGAQATAGPSGAPAPSRASTLSTPATGCATFPRSSSSSASAGPRTSPVTSKHTGSKI
jgi:hypothetical protein